MAARTTNIDHTDRRSIINALKAGECALKYKTTSGDIRTARGTLHAAIMPSDNQPKAPFGGDNKDVITYWDLDKKGWRSFTMDGCKKVTTTAA